MKIKTLHDGTEVALATPTKIVNSQRYLLTQGEIDAREAEEVQAAIDSDAALIPAMRDARDLLLMECDWTQLTNNPLGADTTTLWAAYRQDLRDLPSIYPDGKDIVWPTTP